MKKLNLLPDAKMRELIAESYENVRSKLPRAVKAKLEGTKQVSRRSKIPRK